MVEVEFEVTVGLATAIFRTTGVATLERFRQGIQALVDHPQFRPGMPILVDHTDLDMSGMRADDVRAIGDFVAKLGHRIGPSAMAVVVPDTLTFGFVRMSEAQAKQPQFRVRVFYTRLEAVDWLEGETPTSPS